MLFFVLTFNLHIYKVDESEKSFTLMTWSFVQSGEVYILVNNYSLNLICKKKSCFNCHISGFVSTRYLR